jgi:cyclic pyranopterin phosphate synthase
VAEQVMAAVMHSDATPSASGASPATGTAATPALSDRLGRPLRDLRLSVIEACNFRCPYCMPADRIADDHGMDSASRLSFDEIERIARGFVRAGVR